MPAPFFDAHTHAHFAGFESDYRQVIARALQADIKLINVGTLLETSRRAVAVAHEFEGDGVWAAVGMHPSHAGGDSFHDKQEVADMSVVEDFDHDAFATLAADPKVVAIGECGLDYFRLPEGAAAPTIAKQKEVFLRHIDLSREVKKPLMIHCREAFGDLINVLQSTRHNLAPGVIHFFTGTQEDARQLLDLGFSFTFGGVVTFTNAYDEIVQSIPMENILSETDAPYVAPVPYRGKRNEPLYVVETVKKLAQLKGVTLDQMRETIWQNGQRIFNL